MTLPGVTAREGHWKFTSGIFVVTERIDLRLAQRMDEALVLRLERSFQRHIVLHDADHVGSALRYERGTAFRTLFEARGCLVRKARCYSAFRQGILLKEFRRFLIRDCHEHEDRYHVPLGEGCDTLEEPLVLASMELIHE